VKTAGLIREAQLAPVADNGSPRTVPGVVQLPVLMEQDFGFYEGKKFHERPADSKMTGHEHHRLAHKNDEGFVDVESKESLARRADSFLDEHLIPIMHKATEQTQQVIAVVSHGIMLSALWKRLLLRLPPRSVTLSAELVATPPPSLEHLGGWSNTGYLELYMTQQPVQDAAVALEPPVPAAATDDQYALLPQITLVSPIPMALDPSTGSVPASVVTSQPQSASIASSWSMVIETINGKDHLQTLKRTRGGVGSSRHDPSQRNIDSFFKRRKVD
jgi:hypothetical protein